MIWEQYIEHVSYSSLSLHERNPVVWAWCYLEGQEMPQGEWMTMDLPCAEFGKIFHKILEKQHQYGGNGGEKLLACEILSESTRQKMLDMLQCYIEVQKEEFKPKVLEVEKEFKVSISSLLPPVKGFIDIYIPEWSNNLPLIVDHKVKKKTYWNEEKLKTERQFLTYGYFFTRGKGVNIRVNEFLPLNKKKVLKITDTVVTDSDLFDHNANWLTPQTKAVVATIEAYHEGGMELVYELYSKYDTQASPFGRACPFLEQSLELDKEITW